MFSRKVSLSEKKEEKRLTSARPYLVLFEGTRKTNNEPVVLGVGLSMCTAWSVGAPSNERFGNPRNAGGVIPYTANELPG